MKKLVLISSILSLVLVILCSNVIENDTINTDSNAIDNDNAFTARINTYKYECKQLLKPFRYEGSRVTFYIGGKETQIKSIESYLILDTEYKFVFSGKEASSDVGVKIYESENKNVLLKEIKNIKGKNVVVSTNDFLHVFRKKISKTERLKSVFIEYSIETGSEKNEALILVIGYKD